MHFLIDVGHAADSFQTESLTDLFKLGETSTGVTGQIWSSWIRTPIWRHTVAWPFDPTSATWALPCRLPLATLI